MALGRFRRYVGITSSRSTIDIDTESDHGGDSRAHASVPTSSKDYDTTDNPLPSEEMIDIPLGLDRVRQGYFSTPTQRIDVHQKDIILIVSNYMIGEV